MQEPKKRRTKHSYYIVCHGKERFHSWAHAERIRKKMGRNHATGKWHPYHCPYCNKYHLGSKGRKETYYASNN